MNFRKLNKNEIEELINNECTASDWQSVNVVSDFMVKSIKNSHFSGEVFLGKFDSKIEIYPGFFYQSGIYNSTIHNCVVSSNTYISDVKLLMNYEIQENVVLINCDKIAVYGESYFGNGVEIEVLNEGGGRELRIFEKLSAQMAYMLVNYHHSAIFIKNLNRLVENYIDTSKSAKGLIAQNTRIENCKQIENVKIGSHAKIYSVLNLQNGTIASNNEAPITVGEGVNAKNFIIQSGSTIDGSAILHNCFVGQSVQIGKQFSAENSAFFANCEGFHGEACSVFAGPYTVTHHKSTLLIAGMYSFYNAGSGTNQSNHMYKLGPVHQGIMERGAKTGSFSYLLWPSRIGAFSVVVGKHYSNFDASLLPFSYIVESNSKSVLSPAMNLFTVGTRRDSQKWKKRDKRKDSKKYDLIHFELFNPYTIGKIVAGMEVLTDLYEKADKKQEYVLYKGIHIKRLMLKTCRNYYDMAIKIYLGNFLTEQLEKQSFNELIENLNNSKPNTDVWIDIFGLMTPKLKIDELIDLIEQKKIDSIEHIYNNLQELFNNYKKFSLLWAAGLIEKIYNINISDFSKDQFVQIINDWKKNAIKLNNMIINDASKEFDSKSRIGFGIDGNLEIKDKDFEAVRGTFELNSFVNDIQKENTEIENIANQFLESVP